jgi:Stigma-specific protein, Stig1
MRGASTDRAQPPSIRCVSVGLPWRQSLLLLGLILGFPTHRAKAQATPNAVACPSERRCGNACVDLGNAANNCGSCGAAGECGKACFAGKGKEIPNCKPGKTSCGGRCVDLSKDRKNCGACGNTCASDQSCSRRTCMTRVWDNRSYPPPLPSALLADSF